ncbi:MAG: hypothetical protein AAGC57_01030 [Pseudomonadota bacterium]
MTRDARETDTPRPIGPDRKTRDAGLILPLAGLVALMPPAGQILAVEGTLLGVPVVVLYVFLVWALLILLAYRLARRLNGAPERPDGC